MISKNYSKAYTEVLEMIKHLPENEYNKIPKKKIEFWERNKDNKYKFVINPQIELEKQNISIEANSIIVTIFRDYFATDLQKEKLKIILEQNENKYQEQLREKYNPDNLFENRKKECMNPCVEKNTSLLVVEREENFFKKLINYVKKLIFKR